ncbi:3-keto-5-aminohexanoate cleavage protein [Bradyrhizobium sp. LMG 9283]|uniref:3-keto-5-aminohexanoate cleavage protein n=1 Tax=Bradyrhizobium sp. LMG 9283 TaxID=592064 RepID=UPI00388F997C
MGECGAWPAYAGDPDQIAVLPIETARVGWRWFTSTYVIQKPGRALGIGANVRVVLEDNLYLSRWRLPNNTELVQRAVEVL